MKPGFEKNVKFLQIGFAQEEPGIISMQCFAGLVAKGSYATPFARTQTAAAVLPKGTSTLLRNINEFS